MLNSRVTLSFRAQQVITRETPLSQIQRSLLSELRQVGLTQFQAAARKRESMRLKLQMGAAPGILEKDLAEKIRVEESVCKVFEIVENLDLITDCWTRVLPNFSARARMKRNAWRLRRTCCWASWGSTCSSLSWTSWEGAEEVLPGNRAILAMPLSVYLI